MVLTFSKHLGYFGLVALLVVMVPKGAFQDEAALQTFIALGVLGTWRYSWAAINFVRAIIFLKLVYPRRKRAAFARFEASGVRSHAIFLVTTYMVETESTIACYRAIFTAAARARDGATVVVSVVHGADERLIRSLFQNSPEDLSQVKLIFDRIVSVGKRDALARALLIVAKQNPTANDIVIFVDGDTCVPEDIVAKSAPFFTNPEIGALTTDEAVIIDKKSLFHDWFDLRFNQRQVMMCSMGLSEHVLTLTGRMSVFRASLVIQRDFIDGIWSDNIDHWRLGRVSFLTGDDKSTWFWLLKNGYKLAYLPDTQSYSMETQPRETFYDSAKVLMVRWFGNMIRTNGRALKLAPSRIGLFTWYSILDQRLSMWTTLIGPISIILTALVWTGAVIPIYIAWVMVTRYFFSLAISLFRGSVLFPISNPPLLYFSQTFGAILKVYVTFRMDRQRWTRQGAGSNGPSITLLERAKAYESLFHHVLGLAWLTFGVAFLISG